MELLLTRIRLVKNKGRKRQGVGILDSKVIVVMFHEI